jgi:hypothetical protein
MTFLLRVLSLLRDLRVNPPFFFSREGREGEKKREGNLAWI